MHRYAPIVADAEAGFGGPLNAYEMMKVRSAFVLRMHRTQRHLAPLFVTPSSGCGSATPLLLQTLPVVAILNVTCSHGPCLYTENRTYFRH